MKFVLALVKKWLISYFLSFTGYNSIDYIILLLFVQSESKGKIQGYLLSYTISLEKARMMQIWKALQY